MSKNGFTILELLVVISVLVILIAIGIPRIKGMQDAGKIAKAKAELKTIQTAVESYYIFTAPSSYPTAGGCGINTGLMSTLVAATPQVLSASLADPFERQAAPDNEYASCFSSNAKYYVILSVGPDGTSGIFSAPLAVSDIGVVTGKNSDDICITNGSGC